MCKFKKIKNRSDRFKVFCQELGIKNPIKGDTVINRLYKNWLDFQIALWVYETGKAPFYWITDNDWNPFTEWLINKYYKGGECENMAS